MGLGGLRVGSGRRTRPALSFGGSAHQRGNVSDGLVGVGDRLRLCRRIVDGVARGVGGLVLISFES
jgi:hypothetical protein